MLGNRPDEPAGSATVAASRRHASFPRLRWLALLWLAVYLPSYTLAYGVRNFAFLCNIGVVLTAAGLWLDSRLLISSQALAAPLIGLAWALDAGWRLATGAFLFGGTAYMWDPQYPLFTRLLSLYHLAWPPLVVWCAVRSGYDRRGYPLQVAIGAIGLLLGRVVGTAEENINFAWADPFLGRSFGPPAAHLTATLAVMAIAVYGVPHLLLTRPGAGDPRGGGRPTAGPRSEAPQPL